jgi:nitrogen fixation protein FixH
MTEPLSAQELARKNMLWGWALFGVFVALFGGTVVVALVYLWLD